MNGFNTERIPGYLIHESSDQLVYFKKKVQQRMSNKGMENRIPCSIRVLGSKIGHGDNEYVSNTALNALHGLSFTNNPMKINTIYW